MRGVLEVRPGDFQEGHEVAEPERRRNLIDIILRDLEVLHQDGPDARRHGILHAHPYDRAEASQPDGFLDRAYQVGRFVFLDLDVGIARQTEHVGFLDGHAGEKHAQILRDQVFQPDVAECVLLRISIGNLHKPREDRRHFHAREAFFPARGSDDDREAEAQVGDVRKRMPGVECERGEHRKDLAGKQIAQLLVVFFTQLFLSQEMNARGAQLGMQILPEAAAHLRQHAGDPLVNSFELLKRRPPVGGVFHDVGDNLLLDHRHTDHEELIQVGTDDRQEFHPFQERMALVACFFQHPLIELKPAQLAIDIERGIERERALREVVVPRMAHARPFDLHRLRPLFRRLVRAVVPGRERLGFLFLRSLHALISGDCCSKPSGKLHVLTLLLWLFFLMFKS